ncbi:hypothetical protein GJ496_005835 [Pomphorhynchus laevis]|nr:hypothetical protein GJ496_005835 [Pomphorhynchus laevis]
MFRLTYVSIDQYIGLTIRPEKSEIIFNDRNIRDSIFAILPGAKLLHFDSTDMLGLQVGNHRHSERSIIAAIEQLTHSAPKLCSLNPHDALYILRNCISLPKIEYLLCSAPCIDSVQTKCFDNVIRSTLRELLNFNKTERTWRQATLLVGLYGI